LPLTLRRRSLNKADAAPLRLVEFGRSAEERRERACGSIALAAVTLEPRVGLLRREGDELNLRDAAPRTRNRRMERAKRFVGRHQDENAESLPDQPVDDVEQPRQTLAGLVLRVEREQLARVFEN
jgi:hypothetical protein